MKQGALEQIAVLMRALDTLHRLEEDVLKALELAALNCPLNDTALRVRLAKVEALAQRYRNIVAAMTPPTRIT